MAVERLRDRAVTLMEWIKIDKRLRDNIKVRRFARRINASIPEAAGYLLFLWSWTAINARDGDLSALDDDDIADAADYPNAPKQFVEALIDVGLLDSDRRLHDWDEHNGASLAKQEERKQYFKDRRQTIKSARTVREQCANSASTESAQGEHRERTESAQCAHSESTALRSKNIRVNKDLKTLVCSDEFEQFWEVYPRQINKVGAYKAWNKCLKAGAKREDIQTAAEHYAESCRQKNTEAQFVMHPTTFLGRDQRWTEYVKGIPKEAMSSYDRAIAEGPKLDGVWGEMFGHVKQVEMEEAIGVDGSGLGEVRGADTWGGRGDESQYVPY